MFKPTVIFSNAHKTVTIVGVNGDTLTRNAATTLNVSFRKDGGVTVWADGEHSSQTTRVDSYGRLYGRKSVAFGQS
jgi:hypothetical protein